MLQVNIVFARTAGIPERQVGNDRENNLSANICEIEKID